MKVFTIVFLIIVFGFILFLAVMEYNEKYSGKPKEFFKKFFKYILFILATFLVIGIIIVLWGICYKVTGNLLVASILTVAIGLIVFKFIDK